MREIPQNEQKINKSKNQMNRILPFPLKDIYNKVRQGQTPINEKNETYTLPGVPQLPYL